MTFFIKAVQIYDILYKSDGVEVLKQFIQLNRSLFIYHCNGSRSGTDKQCIACLSFSLVLVLGYHKFEKHFQPHVV